MLPGSNFIPKSALLFAPLGALLLISSTAYAGEPAPETQAAPDDPVADEYGVLDPMESQEPAPPPVAAPEQRKEDEMAAARALHEAGDVPMKNSVYLEVLGAGLFYSFNYERLVIPQIAVRIGIGYVGSTATVVVDDEVVTARAHYIAIPVTASYIGLRKGPNALEVLAGATMNIVGASGTIQSSETLAGASGSAFAPIGTVGVGYRLHPMGRAGFQFRIGMMGLIGPGFALKLENLGQNRVGMLPWGYMSFGGSF